MQVGPQVRSHSVGYPLTMSRTLFTREQYAPDIIGCVENDIKSTKLP